MTARRRILVLGGGCAGMAAAWQLSCTPERRRAFDVTVASMGWRLGGKGTTGRSLRHGGRIHEHGLHIWMGFYDNAFALMREVFEAWTPPPGSRLRSIEDGFVPHYTVSLHDRRGHLLHLALPPRPGRPWSTRTTVPDWRRWRRELRAWARGPAREALRANGQDVVGAVRHTRDLVRLVRTIARGLASDRDRTWEQLDDEDLCAWLRRHGPDDPGVYDASAVRAFYNLAFAYPDGRSGFGRGEVAAGAALSSLLRMGLGYRGAPLWKMTAGMGDTVFVPMYEVLRDRGVRFDLFRRVDGLRVEERRITRVELGVQADAPDYDPLITLQGERCWPDAPLTDRLQALADGDAESQEGGTLRTEVRERGRDFDGVVLAIPVPVHRRIAGDLRVDAAYGAMVDHHASVVTVAAQLWSRASLRGVGWSGPPTVCVNGSGALSSWADMSEVLPAEGWGTPPGSLLYFVDTAPDDAFEGSGRREAGRAAAASLRSWLSGPGFPATDQLVHGPLEQGQTALDAQYVRANVDPAERYVLTPPGSTRYRLGPDSGFDGLWLAGDWTRTSINGGSVEAAAESGRRAGEAVAAAFGQGSGELSDAPV